MQNELAWDDVETASISMSSQSRKGIDVHLGLLQFADGRLIICLLKQGLIKMPSGHGRIVGIGLLNNGPCG